MLQVRVASFATAAAAAACYTSRCYYIFLVLHFLLLLYMLAVRLQGQLVTACYNHKRRTSCGRLCAVVLKALPYQKHNCYEMIRIHVTCSRIVIRAKHLGKSHVLTNTRNLDVAIRADK